MKHARFGLSYFAVGLRAAVRALREGDHVVVIGAVNVYEKGGALSFIIEQLFSQGTGSSRLSTKKSRKNWRPRAISTVPIKKNCLAFPGASAS